MPWLNQGGIAELYGLCGAGKTNVTFAIAFAVAGGTSLADSRDAPPLRVAARAARRHSPVSQVREWAERSYFHPDNARL